MKLFRVERTTKPKRQRNVDVATFAVIAETDEEAVAKAKKAMPQDELDGPVVRWHAEEDVDGWIRGRSFRRPGDV